MFFFKKKSKKVASKQEDLSGASLEITPNYNDLLKLSFPDDISSSLDLPHLQGDQPSEEEGHCKVDTGKHEDLPVKLKEYWLPTTRLISGQILNTSVNTTNITATSLGNPNNVVTTSSYNIESRETSSSVSSGSSDTTVAPRPKALVKEAGVRDVASLDDEAPALLSDHLSDKEVRSIPQSRSGTFEDPKEVHRSVRDSLILWGHRASGFTQKETVHQPSDLIPNERQDAKQTTTHVASVPEQPAAEPREKSAYESTMHDAPSDAAQGQPTASHVQKEISLLSDARTDPCQPEPQPAAGATNTTVKQDMVPVCTPAETSLVTGDNRSGRGINRRDKETTEREERTSLSSKRSNTSLIPRGNRQGGKGEKKATPVVAKKRPGSEASDSAGTVTDDDNDVPKTPTSATSPMSSSLPKTSAKSRIRRQSTETGLCTPKAQPKRRAAAGKDGAKIVTPRNRTGTSGEGNTVSKQNSTTQSKIPVRGEPAPVGKRRESSVPSRKTTPSRMTTRTK